jgi:putative Holliday junction resolvase
MKSDPDSRYRVLAIDYGTKRIGLAVSDELRMLASARGVLENAPTALGEIRKLIERENIKAVVVGLPTNLKGEDSPMTAEVRLFGEKISLLLTPMGIHVEFRDERLTSVMANYFISQSGLPKSRREEKGRADEEAARILLQEYLDEHRRG